MRRKLIRDLTGGILVEAAVMIPILFVFVLGSIDFLFAFYQWNSATKAAQLGARLAAVSDPVDAGLNGLSTAVLSSSVQPGDPMPANAFAITCNGSSGNCSGTGAGTYSALAMNKIVFGRSSTGATTSCPTITTGYNRGMCHMFSRVMPANVNVTYEQTGLGYAGRPGGPLPTITVQLQGLPFQFFFLGGFNLQIPSMTTTITGEDLSFSAPS
jgi:Flp pilus assembly protein TadG